jgi:hypothetical protein
VVLGGDVSSEAVVVVVLMFQLGGRAHAAIVAVDGRGAEPPDEAGLYVDLGALVCEPEDIRMVLSADVAYVFLGSAGVVQWSSVSRGVAADGQVRGQYEVSVDTMFLGAVDCVRGLGAADVPVGGCAGFVQVDSMVTMSARVPAPLGVDVVAVGGGAADEGVDVGVGVGVGVEAGVGLLWRAHLQYAGEQYGAAQATLATLLASSLDGGGRPAVAAVDEAVLATSRAIVDTPPSASDDASPLSLLIDAQLEDKVSRHAQLLGMLADARLLASCEYDGAGGGDRLWDLLSDAARAAVVAHAEKLAAAHRLRAVENANASRTRSHWVGGGTSTAAGSERSFAASAQTMTASVFGSAVEDDLTDEPGEEGARSIVAEALRLAGAEALDAISVDPQARAAVDDAEVVMYGLASQFERFLPALRSCVVAAVARAVEDGAGGAMEDEDRGAAAASRMRRLACRDILLASDAALAVVDAAREVREEAQASHSFDLATMEPSGGWSCHPVLSRAVLNDLIAAALAAAKSCRPGDAKVLRKCAVSVSNALLECARSAHLEEQLRSGSPGGNSAKSPSKRRRLAKAAEMDTIWGVERRAALAVLREHKLVADAFDLARKFEDFGMMLALKCRSDDFDAFVESAVEEFGREFAHFAFEWLETRGEVRLLIFGQAGPAGSGSASGGGGGGGGCRSPAVKNLLVSYFSRDRRDVSNLSWMLQLASGEFEQAAAGLARQAAAVGVPGKQASLPNAKVLLSVAKLALHAVAPPPDAAAAGFEGDRCKKADGVLAADVDRRLYLLRAQSRLDGDADVILPVDELVQRFLAAAPVDSGSLAEAVVLALEALDRSHAPAAAARNLRDLVWRQCIERQAHHWLPLLNGTRALGDAELRRALSNTALYEAACRTSLRRADAHDLVSRGALDIAEVDGAAKTGGQLGRLVQTTVGLAEESLAAAAAAARAV